MKKVIKHLFFQPHTAATRVRAIRFRRKLLDLSRQYQKEEVSVTQTDFIGEFNIVKLYCPQFGQWRHVRQYSDCKDKRGDDFNSLLIHIAFRLTQHQASHFANCKIDAKKLHDVLSSKFETRQLVMGAHQMMILGLTGVYRKRLFYFNSSNIVGNIINAIDNTVAQKDYINSVANIWKNTLGRIVMWQEPLGIKFSEVLFNNIEELYSN